jgi:hypothetical protein
MAKSENLLTLVGALIRDSEVRRRFNEKPNRVMKEYGLTADDKKILWSMTPATIEAAVDATVLALFKTAILNAPSQMDKDEFPPIDDDYVETGTGPLYPDPIPTVFRVRPRKIQVPATSKAFEFSIFGQSFSRDPEAKAKVKLGTTQMAVKETVFGTFRCSRLHVVVRPTGGGTVSAGTYDVTFVNCPGGGANELTLDAGQVEVEHV